MRISIVCACLLFQASFSFAQLKESFDYQHINDASAWEGTDTAWEIRDGQLKSHLQQANTLFYISTPSPLARNAIWECRLRLDFNTSSLNYIDFFLVADSANLLAADLRGYFVRVGNTRDEVCLYRKEGNTPPVLLIDGRDGVTDHASTTLRVKVIRKDNEWSLWTDEKGDGTAYVREGTATDQQYDSSRFTGLAVRQSTASFFGRHYFDEIYISPFVADTVSPAPGSWRVYDSRTLEVCFDEPLDSTSVYIPEHYSLSTPDNPTDSVWMDSGRPSCLYLRFRNAFPDGDSCSLFISGLKDLSGNMMELAALRFLYYVSKRYDVLIHEFLPRALPSAGLLPARFVELRNNSPYAQQLKGWRIGNSSREAVLPERLLQPGDLLVLCDKANVEMFPNDVVVAGIINFPAPGDSDILTLRNDSGILIHAVAYDRDWYNNPVKEKGGWSLEMRDTNWPCVGSSNWLPSSSQEGGTPGRGNTAAAPIAIPPPVSLVKVFPVDTTTLDLVFDGAMDSIDVTDPGHFKCTPPLSLAGISARPPLYNNVSLHFTGPFLPDTLYAVTVSGLRDCTGQPVIANGETAFGRLSIPDSLDVVINEILYDPPLGVPEFIEIYNRSGKVVDLSRLHLARKRDASEPDNVEVLTSQPALLLPRGYAAFTTAPAALCNYYNCFQPGNIYKTNLPALINNAGTVVLLNGDGRVLDELHYSDKMHSGIANNTRGVSLERLAADGATQDKYNWYSAAATARFATPGYHNSHQHPVMAAEGEMTVQPRIFSPDNDGQDDLAIVRYNFPMPGNIINVTIFDTEGRPVRYLERNTIVPASGYMTWDGRAESNRELMSGIYIIFAEAFNTDGWVRQWKLPVVLGRR